MTASGWRRIKEILSDALEIPDPAQRANLVGERCGADSELLGTVMRFLSLESSTSHSDPLVSIPSEPENFDPGPRYSVERLLGAGGVSQVFLARDTQMANRLVVLKTLTDQSTTNSWIRLKARHEMEALARIGHHHVVKALDFYIAPGGRAVLVLEYLDGLTVRQAIASAPMSAQQVILLTAQIASALDAVHSTGVLHRDLKPENIVLQPESATYRAILIDFGIAKVESPTEALETDTVILAGTTCYMAPEQLMGAAAATSDQYALAVIAFELLTGSRPFYASNPVQLYKMQHQPRTALRSFNPNLSPAVCRVLERGLAFDPRRRYSNCVQFAKDLECALNEQPTSLQKQSRRNLLVGLTATTVAATAAHSGRQQLEDFYDSFSSVPELIEWDGIESAKLLGFELHYDLETQPLPNATRLGYKGYKLTSKSQGELTRILSRAHKKQLVRRGWTLSCEIAAITGCTFVILDLAPYRKRFDLYVVARGNQQILVLHDGYKPTFRGREFVLPGRPGTIHNVEFTAPPGSLSASVSIDGKMLPVRYSGQPDYQFGYTLSFGTAQYGSEIGEGVINSLRLKLG